MAEYLPQNSRNALVKALLNRINVSAGTGENVNYGNLGLRDVPTPIEGLTVGGGVSKYVVPDSNFVIPPVYNAEANLRLGDKKQYNIKGKVGGLNSDNKNYFLGLGMDF
jgi:hypothetical protein